MPAKAKGGKRQKRNAHDQDYARELILKEEGEEYGLVLKELGNRVLKVYCLGDNKIRLCHIPKKIRERIRLGDVILVVKREFATEDDDADIYHKYQPEEVRQLKDFKHIPDDLEGILESEGNKLGINVKAEQEAARKEMEAGIEDKLKEIPPQKVNNDDIDDL